MERLKRIEELTQIDRRNLRLVNAEGQHRTIEVLYDQVSSETLNEEVPEELKDQFNVARNMALYTHFYYALAPEVHLKTYSIIEHALRLKLKPEKRQHATLRPMLEAVVDNKLICDSGFRHLNQNEPSTKWCRSMIKAIPHLRNTQAHGSNFLMGDCSMQISVCADFLNQLFPSNSKIRKR